MNNLIFIAVLIGLIFFEALLSAYFGNRRKRPRWVRWYDLGLVVLLVVFAAIIVERTITLLKM